MGGAIWPFMSMQPGRMPGHSLLCDTKKEKVDIFCGFAVPVSVRSCNILQTRKVEPKIVRSYTKQSGRNQSRTFWIVAGSIFIVAVLVVLIVGGLANWNVAKAESRLVQMAAQSIGMELYAEGQQLKPDETASTPATGLVTYNEYEESDLTALLVVQKANVYMEQMYISFDRGDVEVIDFTGDGYSAHYDADGAWTIKLKFNLFSRD